MISGGIYDEYIVRTKRKSEEMSLFLCSFVALQRIDIFCAEIVEFPGSEIATFISGKNKLFQEK